MGHIKLLDDLLFEKVFERFAHWFERKTKYDNFFLARITLYINVVVMLVLSFWSPLALLYLMLCSVMLSMLCNLTVRVKHCQLNSAFMSLKNKLRRDQFWFFLRMYTLFYLAYSLGDKIIPSFYRGKIVMGTIFLSMSLSTLSFAYLLACTPIPPKNTLDEEDTGTENPSS